MRIGVQMNPNGKIGMSRLGLYLDDMKKQCLLRFIFKAQQIAIPVSQKIMDSLNNTRQALGLDEVHWYCMDIDPLSNTMTITPPLLDEDKRVIFDWDKYDVKVKREGWPALVLDMEPLWGFAVIQPNKLKALQAEAPAENEQPEPADKA